MDGESIKVLDDIREFDDLIEVEYRPLKQEPRTIVGLYAGLQRARYGAWYMKISGKATIRTIDILSVRRKEPVEARWTF